MRRPARHRRSWRCLVLVALLAAIPAAHADYSLRLGVPLLGWDRVEEGTQFEAARGLARGIGAQFGYLCLMPEAFLRPQSPSVLTALLFYAVPSGATEEILLNEHDRRVSLVGEAGVRASLVVIAHTEAGVLLVVCDG